MVEEALYDELRQASHPVRFDWGRAGAAAISSESGCTMVVDVLSFTTAVSVAVGMGTVVFPHPLGAPGAKRLAEEHDAALAVRRRDASPDNPWSLSPSALRQAPFTPRLVLPSPNGSAIAASVTGVVLAACLRNARASVGRALTGGFGVPGAPISVVAAGELWPDGSLRPALEDALGAGVVLHHLKLAGCALSPEAGAMAALCEATADVAEAVRKCATAQELVVMGFGTDVTMAVETDVDGYAAVKIGAGFRRVPEEAA